MKPLCGKLPPLFLLLLLSAGFWPSQAAAQSSAIAPVRGEVTEAGKATPLPGAVLRWLFDALDAAAPVITTTTDDKGRFTLVRPARAASRLAVQALGYAPDTIAVPVAGTPYLRVALKAGQELGKAGQELGEVTVTARGPAYSAITPANVQMISSRDLTKSACCNLAESFETNASVEVTTSDAVSGAKQIQLLGLDGSYSLLTVDNQPALRGLAAPYRLGYLAGPWIENIEIIKGTGSVVNGYEAISGQVNVKLKEPEKTDQLLFNSYVNDLGKFDINLNTSARINPKWSTVLLLHTDHLGNRADRNKDGFLDLPLATQFNAFNKWKYLSGNGFVSEVGLGALRETRQGGQLDFRDTGVAAFTQHYGTTQATTRYTGYAKTSYTWPTRPFQSLGLLLSGTDHDFTSRYSYGYQAYHTNHDPSLPPYFVTNRASRSYDGTQRTGLATLLFQSAIGNTAHVYRTGLSFLYDNYDERLSDGRTYITDTPADVEAREHRTRRELVPGAFAEYTYQNSRNLTLVAGLRADRHNLYGWQVTPRLNLKYDVLKNTVLRLAAGSGFRVANPIADNAAMLASAREFVISPNLRPEKAWNFGGSATQYFTVLRRPATLVVDYYHTEFQNQVVADMYTSPSLIDIGNLQAGGRSYARSLQGELQIEPLKGLQVKGAYKYLDVRTTYDNILLPKPLTPAHRAFLNMGYASAFDKWRADFTVQWFGERAVAHVSDAHQHGSGQEYVPITAPRYGLLNTQLTRAFKRLEVYVGVENLTNYRQPNPIDGAANPFGPTFDAAMVWGPVYGRLTYAGLRYRIE